MFQQKHEGLKVQFQVCDLSMALVIKPNALNPHAPNPECKLS